jgi:cell division protein FtsZ
MNPTNLFEEQAVIKVIGVGGAGCNAVNRMVESGIQGVEFVAMNTDSQALDYCKADTTLQLGESLTRGLGSGGDPEKGAAAAKESEKKILEILDGADMIFITAGMGGGTGTGAAPIVAQLANRMDILTVGVVTKPFIFEGPKRKVAANSGTERIAAEVDTLIVIPNDKLMETVEVSTKIGEAFKRADEILTQGVQGISDIVLRTGIINLDFADVKAVMKGAGLALMGMGSGTGDRRAELAAIAAANSPLLETGLEGAKRLLVNVTAGDDFTLGEIQDVMAHLSQYIDSDSGDIYLGHVSDPSMQDEIRVTILAAGLGGTDQRPREEEVFGATTRRPEPRRRTETVEPEAIVPDVQPLVPAPVPVIAAREEAGAEPNRGQMPMELDEIDLDIPTFLRRQRSGD